MVVSEVLSPFARSVEMWLYRTGNYVVFASMYLALLLRVDVSDERSQSQEVSFSEVWTGKRREGEDVVLSFFHHTLFVDFFQNKNMHHIPLAIPLCPAIVPETPAL